MMTTAIRAPLALAVLAAAAAAQFPSPKYPPGNPHSAEKALLGKALFWDEQLSTTGTMACGTCHFPETGGSDLRSQVAPAANTHPGFDGLFGTPDDVIGSAGVIRHGEDGAYEPDPLFGFTPQATPRKTPSMINAWFPPDLFWDGRAKGVLIDPLTDKIVLKENAALEHQALEPPIDAGEMSHVGLKWDSIPSRIAGLSPLELATDVPAPLASFVAGKTYRDLFREAFGSPGVTPVRIAMALATYQRTLVSDQAKVVDKVGFTELESEGGIVFAGQGRCIACHSGPLFTDNTYRNTGVRPIHEDLGRGGYTGDPKDDGKFRVPSLMNVALRAPYFRNGGAGSLAEVVEFYDRGGDFHVDQDPKIEPLGLTAQQKVALVAYMNTFTDPRVKHGLPPFDRPTLFSESANVPQELGAGSPGSGGTTPDAIAIDPPSITNTSFALGLDGGLGGAPAFLVLGAGLVPSGIDLFGATWYPSLTGELVHLVTPALSGSGPGQGYTTTVLDLTVLTPAQIGQVVYGQWAVVDAGSPGGVISTSEAFELTIL